MNSENRDAKVIFGEALRWSAPAERAAYLDQACAGDVVLRQEVESLLSAYAQAQAGDFLNQTCPLPAPDLLIERTGTMISRYKLLEQIGEGGCGVVYLAEQAEPIRRRVALKVIKLGMDTKSVVGRFETERQALALMDHPNIAKVLDAGATETGRPYFVMELVKGIKITEFCDQNKLSTKERLELFMQVCHAVQHAHQKGIIHRDIKPSNILVTLQDGVPAPKVIDFGIAKATQQPLTGKTVFTALQQFIGTPAYMSPEQAELSGWDIDTRADIYALGVLLYELLTGKPPFDPETLLKAGLDEMRRIIRETEPAKPSTKLTSKAESGRQKAEIDRASLRRLLQEVRGDLDWIVMKCLEKDRRRRYETATGLAHDIERHLHNEPITAGAPGAIYRVSKFVRRHRFGLATATALLLLLAAGVVVSTWQAVRATRAQQQTLTVATFLKDMLTSVTPEEAKGRDTKLMLELLDKAVARVDKELKDQPLIAAWLRGTLGLVYSKLGQYTNAEPLLRQALEVQERTLGKEDPDTLNSVNNLASLLSKIADYAGAEVLCRRALEARERTLGKEHPDTLMSVNGLASVLFQKADYAGAEPLYRRALEAQERTLGKEHPDTLNSVNNLANLLLAKGDYPGAEPLYRRALGARERTPGKEHPDTLKSMNDLANLLVRKADYAGAEPLYRRALEAQERTLGKEHPDTLNSVNNLANLLLQKGDYAGAEPLFRRALEARERTLGKEHPDTLVGVNNLALLLYAKADYAGAEPLYRQALEAQERTLGKEHPDTLNSVNNLANLLLAKGDNSRAEPLFLRALEARERTLGKEHPDTLKSMNDLANLLRAKADYAGAEPLYRRALEAQERTLGKDHPDTLPTIRGLANLLQARGDYAGEEALYRRALEARERTLGKEHRDTLKSRYDLANLLAQKGDYAGAEPLFRRALEAQERTLGREYRDTLKSMNDLANLLAQKGDYAGAEPLYRRSLEAQDRTLGREHPDTLDSVNNLANLLLQKADYAGAESLYRRALEARERTLGKEHPRTLMSMNNLANLLLQKADYAGAESLYRRALEAQERTLRKDHPDTLMSANNLANLLYMKADYAGAEPLYRRALEARERTLGREHPDTLMSVNNLASLVWAKGDYAGAEPLYRRALEARERTLGKEHPDTLFSVNSLAILLYKKADYAGAELLYRRVYEGRKKVLGDAHPAVAQSLEVLAQLLLEEGKSAEVLKLMRQSRRIAFGLGDGGGGRQSREEAIKKLSQAIEKDPNPYHYLDDRAFVYGQLGQWQAAADDLARNARFDVRVSLGLGLLLLETGNLNGYSNRRRVMSVTSWGEDPETAAEAAMEMSLLPRDSGWSVPSQLVEIAIARGTNHVRLPYFQLVKGLVEYRQGRFAPAVDWVQKSLAGSGTNYTTAASAGAVLAMARQQLKQSEEARKALAQATQVFETKLPKLETGDLGENWPEWLIARIFLREAKGVVESK